MAGSVERAPGCAGGRRWRTQTGHQTRRVVSACACSSSTRTRPFNPYLTRDLFNSCSAHQRGRCHLPRSSPSELGSSVCCDAPCVLGCFLRLIDCRYRKLRRPNLLGTLEVIKLACTGKRKSLFYVSTI